MSARNAIARLVVTTGGTGGHIFPALAVAAELRRRNPALRALFLGGGGPEGELARKAGLEFRALPAVGVLGKGLRGLLAAATVSRGVVLALGALRRFKPQVVIGFGGYAGFSPVLAAALLGIPTAVHEQNSVPGVTNRLLGKVVRRVFVSFDDRRGMFPAVKVTHTGNPVRTEIAEKYGLRTYSDLASAAPQLTFGAEYDFFEREDGYDALTAAYGLVFAKTVDMDIGLKYQAVSQGKIDVMNIFTTDGQLSSSPVTVLEDDRHFYPSYRCGSVVRRAVLQEHPELAPLLERLTGTISDSDMAHMNYLVEGEGQEPAAVAHAFLIAHDLLRDGGVKE